VGNLLGFYAAILMIKPNFLKAPPMAALSKNWVWGLQQLESKTQF
jgi:hypothetical protein